MPTLRRKRNNVLYFTRAITLLFTFQVWFNLSETIATEINGNNEELLQQSRTISGKEEFYGKEITMLAIQYGQFFNYIKMDDGSLKFYGMLYEHLDLVFGYLKISFKYVFIEEALVKKYGLVAAVLIYLDKKEIDIAPFGYYLVLDNARHMELITPFNINYFAILQPYPEEISRLDVVMRPFKLPVWLCYLFTTVVFVVVSAIIIKNRMDIIDPDSTRISLVKASYNQIDYVIRLFTNQGTSGSHARTRSSFKILTGIWLLCMVVLINAYSGVLTSLLTAPRLKPIAKTLQDVAESQELQVTVEKNNIFSRTFLNATKGYEKVLGDKLRKDPALLVSDIFGARDNIINRKAAYPVHEGLTRILMMETNKRKERCKLSVSPGLRNYPTLSMQFPFSIGSPFAKIYSKTEILMWDLGFIAKHNNKLPKDCTVDKPLEAITRKLTLVDLSPAFFVLGIGFSLSGFCFVVEILSKYILSLSLGNSSKASTSNRGLAPKKLPRLAPETMDTKGPRDVENGPSQNKEFKGAPKVAQFTKKMDTNGPRDVENGPSNKKELTGVPKVGQSTEKVDTYGPIHVEKGPLHIKELTVAPEVAKPTEKIDAYGTRDVKNGPSHNKKVTGAPEINQSTEKVDSNGPRDVKNGPSHNKDFAGAPEVAQSSTEHSRRPMTMQMEQIN